MGGDRHEPSTEELRAVQAEREDAERDMAEQAATADEEHTHERRAERAAYLRAKLDEQAGSDRS